MRTDLSNEAFDTRRLTIRSCRLNDAPALQALMTPAISKWVAAWPTPLSLDTCRNILVSNLAGASKGSIFPAVILNRHHGELVGWLKIEVTENVTRRAELGYWIGEDHQRQGYALEVAEAAIGFAFSRLKAEVVTAGAQTANAASHKLLQKLGMTEDGEREVWASARARRERCRFWKLAR
ncbi:GNAT family N-acetyltransferase [Methylocystis parvus]|uniref:GNAT family N-acetyltransferase n=1 Tax=Methylocystis parvus TaxID=134 RepID=A0A6B8M9P9_9HYPH|nr:GNAT family N-acetyltransferase [Methylocystis parvus]QGM99135.1 GNAT family N-acetyltransferase [Methylocystis parvus]WBK00494.1 GNAT family N-acetyltransferase [Methylocystis parvus OBBP]